MKRNYLLFVLSLLSVRSFAQLTVQSGATFFIQSGATVTVQGDVTSNADIQGTGLLLLKGSAAQNVNMNGFTINPNIEIDNVNNITLTGAARENGLITFTNGKLVLGNNNFILTSAGSFAGAATGKFAETNGTGLFKKEVAANGTVVLPVGIGTSYAPVQFQLTGTTLASATVNAKVISGGHPNKHPRSTDFLKNYWTLSTNGVTGGTVTTTGTYTDPTDVTGTEADIRSMTWNGSVWSMTGASQDNTGNTVTAPLAGTSGDLYAMNRFVLSSPKVFLQGAYAGAGVMTDLLRNSGAYSPGTLPASNLLPLTDPYRSAPYSANFTHVNNTSVETIASSVLNDQVVSTQNIVDWVYLELRTVSSPTVAPVVQTRSALIRKDGVIVDVDGISPVYFKNVDAGSYVISVRHRNHLGISIDPTTPISLNLASSTYDFSTASDAALFGTLGAAFTSSGGVNLMWAGNANQNTNVRYSGIGNDKDVLLADFNLSGTTANYYRSDLNMNRGIRYSGIGNDKDYLLSTVLGSSTANQRTQALPN